VTAIDQRKKYFIYLRLILSLAVIISASFYSKISPNTPLISVIFLVFVIISNILLFFIPPAFFKDTRLLYTVFAVDLTTILIGSYLFTHLDINFILAVFLTILMAAMARSVGFSFLTAIAVNAVYIYITFFISAGVNLGNTAAFFNIPFIFVVALHASFLAEKNNEDMREKAELERIGKFLSQKAISVREQMVDVAGYLDSIIRSFKYGIIILDPAGNVRIFNARCEKMFNVKSQHVDGAALVDLNFLEGIKNAIMDFKFNGMETYEKNVTAQSKDYLVTLSSVTGSAGSIAGILCVVKEA
jgi:signal transduction histidine kinase